MRHVIIDLKVKKAPQNKYFSFPEAKIQENKDETGQLT